MRLFPDIPVCVKGNETRMGKGKGTFEFWACRATPNKIIFEVGGGGMRAEVAQEGKLNFFIRVVYLTPYSTSSRSS